MADYIQAAPKIVFGTPEPAFIGDEAGTQEFFDLIKKHNITDIDCARAYGAAEQMFGNLKWKSQGFVMDTKINPFIPNALTPDNIKASLNESLATLGTDKVHILFLHWPDRATPIAETLATINQAYTEGKFEIFGLSNFSVEEIVEILDLCKKNNWVRPTVYQGNYNAITRLNEDELFPLLRKEKIAFYAYSPTAGGFFTGKTLSKEAPPQDGRFGTQSKISVISKIYRNLYYKDSYFNFLKEFLEFIKPYNVGAIEVALRWLAFHSQLKREDGDAVILGASSTKQLEDNIAYISRGPLPKELVHFIDESWNKIKHDAPPYHGTIFKAISNE
eukprot:TRINITY_DN813_c0_g1_i17.p1 TRINITY_DN813_c0_g1~~TRINITY_DN813_c0_g1_i17.p1  ORF type:complete len:332 (-),score=76.44 TRINITY_DN813_c0_g1_i17:42-1037(-)